MPVDLQKEADFPSKEKYTTIFPAVQVIVSSPFCPLFNSIIFIHFESETEQELEIWVFPKENYHIECDNRIPR